MQKLKTMLFAVLLGFVLAIPGAASALTDAERCERLRGQFGGLFAWASDPRYCTLEGFLLWILQMGLALAGIFATLFIIIGGYRYLSAQGDDDKVEEGKDTLKNAVIGLVVILLASVIVRIAINAVSGNILGDSGGTTAAGGGAPATQGTGNFSALGSAVSIPTSGFAGNQFTVSFALQHGSPEQLRENQNLILAACSLPPMKEGGKTSAFSSTQLELYINGRKTTETVFTVKDATDIRGTLTGMFPAAGQAELSVRVCGREIKSQTVTVVTGSGTGTGSDDISYEARLTACLNEIGDPNECERRLGTPLAPSGSTAVQNAARTSTFSVKKSGDKDILVSVSAQLSSMMLMCNLGGSYSRLSEGTLEVFVDGISKIKASLNTDNPRNVTVTMPESITTSLRVRVEICGMSIGSGEQTLNPSAR